MRRRAALLAVLLVAVACGGEGAPPPDRSRTPGGTPTEGEVPPPPRPSPSPRPLPLSKVRLGLRPVARLDQPLAMAVRRGDDALYVAEKAGHVHAIRRGRVARKPVLDLTGQVSLGTEQGLLGLAFSPDGRFLYVNLTDLEGDTRILEFEMGPGGRGLGGTRREVLAVDQPFANHNGGNLVFGPDGFLYVGLGDGGSGGDPFGNGQNLGTLLGKMLRVEPRPGGGRPYAIPEDNPFVGRPGAREEIWAYGLRNPWRYSFDRETGNLWIGDVGQNAWEEIDFQPAASRGGENYGWNRFEGRHPYQGRPPEDHVLPVHEYPLAGSACAVTGGYVYRGTRIRGLTGAYLFADVCLGDIEAVRLRGGRVREHRPLGLHVPTLVSFGEDAAGELYAISLAGGVYKLVPAARPR